jgi:hypothetical protein
MYIRKSMSRTQQYTPASPPTTWLYHYSFGYVTPYHRVAFDVEALTNSSGWG